MRVVYNDLIPFKGFAAVNVFGVLFVRRGVTVTERMLTHEGIHTRQMWEMAFVLFYLWYGVEWLLRYLSGLVDSWTGLNDGDELGRRAYFDVSFEREAYRNEDNSGYLKNRRLFAWIKFL